MNKIRVIDRIDDNGTVEVIDSSGEIVVCPGLNSAGSELLYELSFYEGEEVTVTYEVKK